MSDKVAPLKKNLDYIPAVRASGRRRREEHRESDPVFKDTGDLAFAAAGAWQARGGDSAKPGLLRG